MSWLNLDKIKVERNDPEKVRQDLRKEYGILGPAVLDALDKSNPLQERFQIGDEYLSHASAILKQLKAIAESQRTPERVERIVRSAFDVREIERINEEVPENERPWVFEILALNILQNVELEEERENDEHLGE